MPRSTLTKVENFYWKTFKICNFKKYSWNLKYKRNKTFIYKLWDKKKKDIPKFKINCFRQESVEFSIWNEVDQIDLKKIKLKTLF